MSNTRPVLIEQVNEKCSIDSVSFSSPCVSTRRLTVPFCGSSCSRALSSLSSCSADENKREGERHTQTQSISRQTRRPLHIQPVYLAIYLHCTCAYSMGLPLVASAPATSSQSELCAWLIQSVHALLFMYWPLLPSLCMWTSCEAAGN